MIYTNTHTRTHDNNKNKQQKLPALHDVFLIVQKWAMWSAVSGSWPAEGAPSSLKPSGAVAGACGLPWTLRLKREESFTTLKDMET